MRAPDAPIGCPSATAPPFTFTRSGSAPSIFVELSTTEEKASFSSMRSTSPIVLPAFSSARAPAFAGVRVRDERRLLHHVALVEGRGEPVGDHRVDEDAVAEAVAEAGLPEEVRSVRHRLHPTRDDHVVVAGANHLVGDLDSADRGRADLV